MAASLVLHISGLSSSSEVSVRSDETVEEILKRIAPAEGGLRTQLISGTSVLAADQTIKVLGLEDGSELQLVRFKDVVSCKDIKDSGRLRKELYAVSIPPAVSNIAAMAFRDCLMLNHVELPDSLTRFGQQAFRGCSSLSRLTVPESVVEVGNEAFMHCTALRSFNMPSVTRVGEMAFKGCSALETVTLGTIPHVHTESFFGCALMQVELPSSVKSIGERGLCQVQQPHQSAASQGDEHPKGGFPRLHRAL